MNIITKHANENGEDITCRLVGSMAKRTSLVDKADIDIFIIFPLGYDENYLKEKGLEFGKYCIDKVGGDYEIRYASHPYITGLIDGFEVDFVPCYNIKDASQLKSAVDRTILHTDYIQSHMTNTQADEVLLLKKFMACSNTYGANFKVSGFSGYLCELLILEYGSFKNVVEAAATKWHYAYKIDLEKYGTAANYEDPLIVIDPVDKNRNVAAALSIQKFSEFIIACRNYRANPSKKYFIEKAVQTTSKEILLEFEKRATNCYILSFNVPQLPSDIIYPQVTKTTKSLERISKANDFLLLETGYYIDSNSNAHIILEYEVDKLANMKTHAGPKIYETKHSRKFRRKYPNAYLDGDKWVSLTRRDFVNVTEMINKVLTTENMIKMGKNVKEEIFKGYEFEKVDNFIKQHNDSSNLNQLYLYLHPTYNLEH